VVDGGDPATMVKDRGLEQVTDEAAIVAVVDEVIAVNPEKAEEYRGGRTGLVGFFVGQVMRETGGTIRSWCRGWFGRSWNRNRGPRERPIRATGAPSGVARSRR